MSGKKLLRILCSAVLYAGSATTAIVGNGCSSPEKSTSAPGSTSETKLHGIIGPKYVSEDEGTSTVTADTKILALSVVDPEIRWGEMIFVDAQKTTGNFSTDVQEGAIGMTWSVMGDQGSSNEIFRSTSPMIPIYNGTMVTSDAESLPLRHSGHWLDNDVSPGLLYYYVIIGTSQGRCMVMATGHAVAAGRIAAAVPNDIGNSTLQSFKGQNEPAEVAERTAMRRLDGVTSIPAGQEAASAGRGTFGFSAAYNPDGRFLLYSEHEPDLQNHPFEIHKLRDGTYSIVGYVDRPTAEAIRNRQSTVEIVIYARRVPNAPEIISVPVRRLEPAVSNRIEDAGTVRSNISATWQKN